MTTPETSREPCPDRILDDVGGAFAMGAIGGSAYHILKGIKNSPTGHRFIGGLEAVAMNAPRVGGMNAPRVGGSFAVWGGLFSAFDCTMVYTRQKEDPWNSIIAGAATGGLLQLRQGLQPVARSALVGGVLLALIEGAGITLNKLANMQQPQQQVVIEEAPQQPTPSFSSSSSSWFGGLFGGKQEEVKQKVKDNVLESFDSPMPPSFEFN